MRSFEVGDKVLLGNCNSIFNEAEKYSIPFIKFTEKHLRNESILTIWKIDVEDNNRLYYLQSNKESCDTAYYEQELCFVKDNIEWDK